MDYLLRPFFKHIYAWIVGSAIVLMSLGQVYLAYEFNNWRKRFWDSLQALDMNSFTTEIWVFLGLAFAFIFLIAFTRYLAQRYCLKWRQYLTEYFQSRWLLRVKQKLDNPDQRIQQDLATFVRISERLFTGVLNAVITLAVFIPILWGLSSSIVVMGMSIPGVLVIIVVGYAVVGVGLSLYVGRRIPGLEYNNEKTEANLRYELVHVRDEIHKDEGILRHAFRKLYDNHVRLYNNYKYFTLYSVCYAQIAIILPYIVVAPVFFSSVITLGVMMQIANAFDQVFTSSAYITENYLEIAALLAVLKRLKEFDISLDK